MAYCYNSYGGRYYCRRYGAWGGWGRWVLLGVILFVFFVALLAFACVSARRRRKVGRKPFYGTAWAAPGAGNYNNQNKPQQMEQGTYNNSNNAYGANTQQYGANPYGGTGQNAEYYGGQQTAQTGTYQPPSYPPPAQTRN